MTNGYDFFDSLSETDDCKTLVASWVFSMQPALDLLPLATQFEETSLKMLFTMVSLFNRYRTFLTSKVDPIMPSF